MAADNTMESSIHNLDRAIAIQKEKIKNLRKKVENLKFIPIDPIGHYSCVSYKAIDGGIMKIDFNPFELDFVEIADSNGREIMKFILPMGWRLTSSDFLFMDKIRQIQKLTKLLGKNSVTELSEVLFDPKKSMEIAEYACIFEKIIENPTNELFLIMKDGLLRTKSIKAELITKLRSILREHQEVKLVGVAKQSKLLSLISAALYIENIFPSDLTGYVKVPFEIEQMAYTWTGHGKIKAETHLDYAFGRLYIGKLSYRSNLLVTIEVPYDFINDRPIYSEKDISELFGHLIKDSMYSYPNLGYPQTIMRAHEKAANLGFTASILRDDIMDLLTDKNQDTKLNEFLRDHIWLKESVDKGVLGGGM